MTYSMLLRDTIVNANSDEQLRTRSAVRSWYHSGIPGPPVQDSVRNLLDFTSTTPPDCLLVRRSSLCWGV
jgi:hypothetical protein